MYEEKLLLHAGVNPDKFRFSNNAHGYGKSAVCIELYGDVLFFSENIENAVIKLCGALLGGLF